MQTIAGRIRIRKYLHRYSYFTGNHWHPFTDQFQLIRRYNGPWTPGPIEDNLKTTVKYNSLISNSNTFNFYLDRLVYVRLSCSSIGWSLPTNQNLEFISRLGMKSKFEMSLEPLFTILHLSPIVTIIISY